MASWIASQSMRRVAWIESFKVMCPRVQQVALARFVVVDLGVGKRMIQESRQSRQTTNGGPAPVYPTVLPHAGPAWWSWRRWFSARQDHDLGFVPARVMCWHDQRRSEVLVPGLGDPGLALEGARFEVLGIEAGMSDPLSCRCESWLPQPRTIQGRQSTGSTARTKRRFLGERHPVSD